MMMDYTATCLRCGDVGHASAATADAAWATFRGAGWADPESMGHAQCPTCAQSAAPDTREANLRRLADIHLRRYAHLLQRGLRGDPSVRVHECRDLIAAWRAVCAAGYSFAACPPEAQREVLDAIEAGE